MRLLLLCSCVLSLCMPAECQNGLLKADLLSLSRASESQVTVHIMLLSEKTHEPARSAVEQFARDLISSRLATVRSSGPAPLQAPQADAIVAEIDSVLKSAGTSTLGFHDHLGQFEKVMLAVGTPLSTAHKLAGQLEIIGRQVRGPEDTPAR
jgi:hypothetical protein